MLLQGVFPRLEQDTISTTLLSFYFTKNRNVLMINVSGLSKSYRQKRKTCLHVLNKVSFDCAPGKITGLLGVNGAGKTTLLRVLSTALSADEGRASIAGYDLKEQAEEVRRSIGFLSASTQLQGRLTVREELNSYGQFFRLNKTLLEERVRQTLEQLEMSKCADSRLGTLSMGQVQRVNIARVMLHDPQILILDEPTTGLDVLSAGIFHELLKSYREQNKTILFSTHNMSDAKQLCDQLIVLSGGKVVAQTTPNEFIATTKTLSLEAAFLHCINGEVT